MLSAESLATIEQFWAADLGCTVDDLRRDEIVVTRGGGDGIFMLSRTGGVVAVPPETPGARVVGPAFIGYADATTYAPCADGEARLLGDDDAPSVDALRAACEPLAWEHGGAARAEIAVGAFAGATLAALASYRIWGERIAHISIVTHPAHRGRGLGTAAVRAITRIAIERALVAQYRTLVANAPSMAIARRLGFVRWAVSLSIRSS